MPPPDQEYGPPFNEAFEQIHSGVEIAVEKFNETMDNINRWQWMLGAAAQWWIHDRSQQVRGHLETVLDRVDHAVDHQLPVLSLISTSFRWLDEVRTPVSELSFQVVDPLDQNLHRWTGEAATAYQSKLGHQQRAVDETVVKTEFVSQWLFGVARSNIEYAVELARVVTELAGHLAQAAVDTAAVINIPWAIDALAEAVGDLVTASLDNLLAIGERFVGSIGEKRDLAAQAGDHSRLPDGSWPQAVRNS